MDTQAIRSKILDLAMRGKLTEQLPEDGTAEELYRQIRAEKQALIKAGKIKKEKPILEISADQLPFEIPENWKWVRLGTILSVQPSNGFSPKAVACQTPYKTLTLTATTSGFFKPEAFKYVSITPDVAEKYFLENDDILVQRSNSQDLVGTSCIYRHGGKKYIYPDLMMRMHVMEGINTNFIDYVLKAPLSRAFFKKEASGTSESMPKINQTTVRNTLIPLPPLAEQNRIVERIEQAFSVLDTIDALQAKYADNRTVLKSKLIDAAIQGKLTEQLPEDGTAEDLYQQIQAEKQALIQAGKIKKEKPLPEITADEIPFEMPSNWCWCRLQGLFNFIDYRGATPNKTSEGVPFVTAKNVRQGYIDYSISEFISEGDYQKRQSRGVSHKGDILFTTEAPMGYAAIADLDRFSAGQRLITLQQYTLAPLLDNKYFVYAISAPFFQKQLDAKCSGTTVKGIKADRLKQFLIPLPPLAEQKRIVARLEEIFPLCRKLK